MVVFEFSLIRCVELDGNLSFRVRHNTCINWYSEAFEEYKSGVDIIIIYIDFIGSWNGRDPCS